MFARTIRFAMVAAVAFSSSARAAREEDPIYSLLTVSVAHTLDLMEGTINGSAQAEQLRTAMEPVKTELTDLLASGKATIQATDAVIDSFLNASDDISDTFKSEMYEDASTNALDVTTLSPAAPKASWTFLHYSWQQTLSKLKPTAEDGAQQEHLSNVDKALVEFDTDMQAVFADKDSDDVAAMKLYTNITVPFTSLANMFSTDIQEVHEEVCNDLFSQMLAGVNNVEAANAALAEAMLSEGNGSMITDIQVETPSPSDGAPGPMPMSAMTTAIVVTVTALVVSHA